MSLICRATVFVAVFSMLLGATIQLAAQGGPDVIVGDLPSTNSYGTNTVAGEVIYAYSLATTSCNIGTENLAWEANNNQHPVIAQDMWRLQGGRISQIGTAWLKHGFCALQNTGLCPGCGGGGGCLAFLTPGCADPYSAGLNGNQGNMGPRSQVNAFNGFFPYPYSAPPIPAGQATIGRRLQATGDDLSLASFPGALYFISGLYVAQDDAAFGNQANNASYRQVSVSQTGNRPLSFIGGTQMMSPPIQAWQDFQPSVTLVDVQVPNEGLFIAGYDVIDNGDGTWNYEYAVYNLYSDRSANSFSIPFPGGATVISSGFHDIGWHSGEPHSGVDWEVSVTPGVEISWSAETFADNPDANALRWSTMYNFYFTSNAPPALNTATLGIFKPVAGQPDSVDFSVLAPSGNFIPGVENLACAQVGEQVDLSWTNGDVYDAIEVARDGVLQATLAGSSLSWTDPNPTPGAHVYAVNGAIAGVPTGPVSCNVTVTAALSISVPGGDPSVFNPLGGETFDVVITPAAGSAVQAGSEWLRIDTGVTIQSIPLVFLGGLDYQMTFPPLSCGSEFGWWIEAQSASGQLVSYPEGGSSAPVVGLSAFGVTFDVTDFEIDSGWTVGAPNDATTGIWTRTDPIGSLAQPEDDHSDPGTQCWFTGQGAVGGSLGANDVDGGSTTLYSQVMDLTSSTNPQVSYFRWYSNDSGASPSADVFVVQVSDDQSTWIDVETVGPGGTGTSGGWIEHSFLVADFVLLSGNVQVRFIASDLGSGSIVEAGIDDFRYEDVDCSGITDCNLNGVPDSQDIANGTSNDCDIDGFPDECTTADGSVADCNGNSVPDICDVATGTEDCDQDGTPDSCEVDTDGDGQIDDCDADLDGDGIPNVCDIDQTTGVDCDANGQIDSCDLAAGAADCDFDGQIDSCQISADRSTDCDLSGILDSCEIASGVAVDCNANGTPDDCEISTDPAVDCDLSGTLDSCDISGGVAEDCNGNSTLDSCEIAADPTIDCDASGALDSCEISSGTVADCNGNGTPDSCDIASGTSADADANGEPDECAVQDWIRGDINVDGSHDISDAVASLEYLFGNGTVLCQATVDVNDDDSMNVADTVFLLGYMFSSGASPAAPFPACGQDPAGTTLPCDSFPLCP
ncbi:MAG: hypothetical protein OSB12_05730 [Planctomycetota bacterium]|nr:hypothetical protein [Planctomycetota bacterium]